MPQPLHISEVLAPKTTPVLSECRIPCTVQNSDFRKVSVKVALKEGDYVWNWHPAFEWATIEKGGEQSFDGFWNTLSFTPPALGTADMQIELHEKDLGKVDTKDFSIEIIERPEWWGGLLNAIGSGNIDQITKPIMDLFTGFDIPGWTAPPYTCYICGASFAGETAEDEFAAHLLRHINAFIGGGWK